MMQSSRADELLAELNYLEQEYGRGQHDLDPNVDTPGEARARIDLLKLDLERLGVRIWWDGRRYQSGSHQDEAPPAP